MTEQTLTPPTEPLTSPVRSGIVDIVKGIAITLVVFGHTAQGAVHRQWWTGPSATASDTFIYSFHMPAFFFVAGLFLAGSLQRRGPAQFTLDKLKTIIYPYVVLALICALAEPVIGRFRMSTGPVNWKNFALDLIIGEAGWFLPTLFLCQILALFTSKIPSWLRFVLALAAAMTLEAHIPKVFYTAVHEFCFMSGGMLVGRQIFKLKNLSIAVSSLGAIAIFALQLLAILHRQADGPIIETPEWLVLVLGFTGTAGLLLVARTLDGSSFGDLWAWIGRASLSVYLLSAFAQGAMREVLLRVAHNHQLWLQLTLPTAFATILTAIIWHQQQRLRLGWVFRWPMAQK